MAYKKFNSVLERLMDKVMPVTETGCWIWMAPLDKGGYGSFGFYDSLKYKTKKQKSVKVKAHIAMYTELVGPIPEGLELDHLCRVRCCVNPAHLEPVTHQENCRRGMAAAVATARSKAKTHCPRGHEYTEENTFITNGGRKCKQCRTLFDRGRGGKKRRAARSALRASGVRPPPLAERCPQRLDDARLVKNA